MKTLLIHAKQHFAQYRNPFTFYDAQTFPLPPKSTIIGMLQNATNKYYDESFWDLLVSVHGGFESVFWNYSNIIKAQKIQICKENSNYKLFVEQREGIFPLYGGIKNSQRTPIKMQELYNGHLWIFIRAKDNFKYWNELKDSLEKPKKILLLGRSEDLIFIDKVIEAIESKETIEEKNIWIQYPTYLKNTIPIKNKKYPVYFIPTEVKFTNNGIAVKSKTEINKEKTNRDTEFQPVIYAGTNSAMYFKENIKIEIFEENQKLFNIPINYGWI
ncbi:MAG: type I-B CRISPR-associated protein Cas5b [Candidatus Pacearchaeota archaeon]